MPKPASGYRIRPPGRFSGLSGISWGILSLCLLIVVLPFLTGIGTGIPSHPESPGGFASSEPRTSAPETPIDPPPADRTQDECQSDPGGDPPDEAEAPSLHPQAAVRKGGALQGKLSRSADGDFRPLGGPPPLRVAAASATFRPPLAFFPGYPVFLLGDLPPPAA